MIIRESIRRGHKALTSRQCRRFLSSDDARILDRTIQNSIKETQAIGARFNALSPRPVQPVDLQTGRKAEQGPIAVAEQNTAFAEQYWTRKAIQKQTSQFGTVVPPRYHPRDVLLKPVEPQDVTLELLLASQSHLGHATSLWNPANAQYIFGIRNGIHVISLDVTAAHLRRAAKIVSAVSERGGLILFVGTRPGQDRSVVKAAELAGGCHLFERWTPGTITNGNQLLANCKMKVVDQFDNTTDGFEDQLRDRAVLKPDLVVCLNPLENYILLHECRTNNIPTIGIIDTDANPTWVTYPIPANDDSLRCTNLIAGVLGRAAENGRLTRLQAAEEGHMLFEPAEGLKAPRGKKAGDEEVDESEFKFWRNNQAGRLAAPKDAKAVQFQMLQELYAQRNVQ